MNTNSKVSVTLHGAAGDVTGSAYAVATPQARLLVDFGIFQGGQHTDALNCVPAQLPARQLDAVLLTHAHLDHTGRLPLLVNAGFTGPIYATPATIEMTALILRDSAKVQAQDTERHNRGRLRAGEEPVPPLYSLNEVETLLQQLRPVPYRDPVNVAPGVQARFVEAGHMLGSTSIQLTIRQEGAPRRVAFSGDLGPKGAPMLRDFETFCQSDLVFLESTYGDRDHRSFSDTVREFVEILQQAVAQQGKVIVPTFAVGRAQVLTLLLAWAFRTRQVKPFPVFLDSPMAIEAWKIYNRHAELFDDEMVAFLQEKPLAEDLTTMKTTATAEESKQINDYPGPCLVMAGAGMCTAGRILHHLRNHVWKPDTSVVIVGFQSEGSLGRQLVEGARKVKIFGETIAVKARVHTLGGFSAHAGQTDLLKWFDAMGGSRPQVVLTHGESKGREPLAQRLRERYGCQATLPSLGDCVEL